MARYEDGCPGCGLQTPKKEPEPAQTDGGFLTASERASIDKLAQRTPEALANAYKAGASWWALNGGFATRIQGALDKAAHDYADKKMGPIPVPHEFAGVKINVGPTLPEDFVGIKTTGYCQEGDGGPLMGEWPVKQNPPERKPDEWAMDYRERVDRAVSQDFGESVTSRPENVAAQKAATAHQRDILDVVTEHQQQTANTEALIERLRRELVLTRRERDELRDGLRMWRKHAHELRARLKEAREAIAPFVATAPIPGPTEKEIAREVWVRLQLAEMDYAKMPFNDSGDRTDWAKVAVDARKAATFPGGRTEEEWAVIAAAAEARAADLPSD